MRKAGSACRALKGMISFLPHRQMLMAGKVEYCAKLSHEAVKDGMCVVIGLQSTGEANTTAVSMGHIVVAGSLVCRWGMRLQLIQQNGAGSARMRMLIEGTRG